MITAKVPFSFIQAFCPISWKDIEFAVNHNYIDMDVPIEFAILRIAHESEPNADETRIAGSAKQDSLMAIVQQLAQWEKNSTGGSPSEKWLCILLAWVYENRASFEDPLGLVEEIYADFDYPKDIAHLVRYMPSKEPLLDTKEGNEERLIKKWSEFVADCRQCMN